MLSFVFSLSSPRWFCSVLSHSCVTWLSDTLCISPPGRFPPFLYSLSSQKIDRVREKERKRVGKNAHKHSPFSPYFIELNGRLDWERERHTSNSPPAAVSSRSENGALIWFSLIFLRLPSSFYLSHTHIHSFFSPQVSLKCPANSVVKNCKKNCISRNNQKQVPNRRRPKTETTFFLLSHLPFLCIFCLVSHIHPRTER